MFRLQSSMKDQSFLVFLAIRSLVYLSLELQDFVQSTPRNELEKLDRVISKNPKFQYKTEFQSHEPEVRARLQFSHIPRI